MDEVSRVWNMADFIAVKRQINGTTDYVFRDGRIKTMKTVGWHTIFDSVKALADSLPVGSSRVINWSQLYPLIRDRMPVGPCDKAEKDSNAKSPKIDT